MTLLLQTSMYINGAFTAGTSRDVEPVINPATEEVIGEAPVGNLDDAELAIAAAHDSFMSGVWRNLKPAERIARMRVFYDALEARRDAIQNLLIAEAGATVALAKGAQYATGMKHFRYYLEQAGQDFTTISRPEITPAGGKLMLGTSVVRRDPVGVVAAITPYNYPFMLNLVKVVPALLMGNSVVLKPSPFTPFSALLFGDIAAEAGLPAGVLNIITGNVDVAARLTTDKRVNLITFTGSDTVGAAIMAQAAPTLKRLLLELGGKSAMIVRPDANLDQAVVAGLRGFTSHSGQGCALMTRHLVHNSLRKHYVERLKGLASKIVVGNPADPATDMGPLIRNAARERAERYVQYGIDSGARLVSGGRRPAHLDRGFFFEPTFFDDVDNGSRIAQEEIFGPIAVVIGYDTDDEAIKIANDSEFALACSIFSGDAGRAYEIAQQIRTGRCAINGGAGTQLSGEPFGGNARSGYGRENGTEGLLEFTNQNAISFHAA
jgi:acyl-CoA reductase-like NAD-dependent aldehyde dehydrogenase